MQENQFSFKEDILIEFDALSKDSIEEEIDTIRRHFLFTSGTTDTGFLFNGKAPQEYDRALYDNGYLPRGLLYYWATVAMTVWADSRLWPVALIDPQERKLMTLSPEGFITWLCSEAQAGAGFVIAVGFDGAMIQKPKWPLPVAGVILPAIDRYGVVCRANSDVYDALKGILPPVSG